MTRPVRLLTLLSGAAAAVVLLSGSGLASPAAPMTEVVVTLRAQPLAEVGRSLLSARDRLYARRLAAAQTKVADEVVSTVPGAWVHWRYRIVANGFSVVLPKSDVSLLRHVPGIAKIWPNYTYHALLDQTPQIIGADRLWGAGLTSAGNGIKIGIIDDGIDAAHPYFNPAGLTYPPGFPKGLTRYTTPKVIVQRTFPPPNPTWKNAALPFDPLNSFHATHVAGIAAGDHDVSNGLELLSGVAPNAYLGNYKALTTPTPEFGLDGNSAEIAAAIEAAVADGMNVINLSLGEPEIEPSRDLVVHAIDAAAAAGVVPVVAAGNDFDPYGYGSIDSPGTAPGAITVAATTKTDEIASFSSAGPTPLSLQFKPDVSAPGVGISSALPRSDGGLWGELDGTSMASPHVAGGVALLEEQHPDWTVAQIKSALVQTADPVGEPGGSETLATREGGGLINLVRADNPLLFAAPTELAFPVNGGSRQVELSDAGGGAGAWTVTVAPQGLHAGVNISASPTATVPGRLTVTATAAPTAREQDVSGFVLLTRGTDTRRIPFWLEVSHPRLGSEPHLTLSRPGIYTGTTLGGATKVAHYRYPTGGDGSYPGPEVVYRVTISKPVANFGVAVLSGRAVPHVTFAGDEDRLVGYTGLPQALNPYLRSFGASRPISGAVLPLPGTYDVVFDTRSVADAGRFTFRFWVDDRTPPRLRLVSAASGAIVVAVADRGAGVDPESIRATLDGHTVPSSYAAGRITIAATPGGHTLVVTASDYQESKNMEDVAAITPNTRTLTVHVNVKGAAGTTATVRRS